MRFTFRQNMLKFLCYSKSYNIHITVSVLMLQNNTGKILVILRPIPIVSSTITGKDMHICFCKPPRIPLFRRIEYEMGILYSIRVYLYLQVRTIVVELRELALKITHAVF